MEITKPIVRLANIFGLVFGVIFAGYFVPGAMTWNDVFVFLVRVGFGFMFVWVVLFALYYFVGLFRVIVGGEDV